LRVATTHLGSSISTLQSLLSQAQTPSDPEHQTERSIIGKRIEKIKIEIVDILRKAVDIVSRHAGSALPEPARRRVKVYILSLPSRWAAASTHSQSPQIDGVSNGMTKEEETGWKVLTLANESLEMLSGVMTVVGDTLQSAENWAGRLGRNKRAGSTDLSTLEPIRDQKSPEMEPVRDEKTQNMEIDG
jgi:hypothetical protein